MPFEWPTAEQMMYRVTRLRRLILLAVAIPVRCGKPLACRSRPLLETEQIIAVLVQFPESLGAAAYQLEPRDNFIPIAVIAVEPAFLA